MSTALQLFQNHLPIGSLDAYIARTQAIPMLTPEEESRLTQDYFDTQNVESARQLVMSHLRFVVKIARGYTGYGLALGDLIQEGNVGLMKAVKRFDPSVGVRLVSFAVHWIKSEIHEFVIRNWRIVKIATTKAQRKLFFNLRQLKTQTEKRLGWFTQAEIDDVAETLNVSTEEVVRMEQRLNANNVTFERTSAQDGDENAYAPEDYLHDDRFTPHAQVEQTQSHDAAHENLHTALANLDDRSQAILQARWLTDKKSTLHELAAKYKVSAERIRQLEQNAMKKLKSAMA